jgi:hypothetical protein
MAIARSANASNASKPDSGYSSVRRRPSPAASVIRPSASRKAALILQMPHMSVVKAYVQRGLADGPAQHRAQI